MERGGEDAPAPTRLTAAAIRRAAAVAAAQSRERWAKLPLNVEVGVDPLVLGPSVVEGGQGPGAMERGLRERRAAGVAALRGVMARLMEGQRVSITALLVIVDDLMDMLSRGPACFAAPALGLPRPIDSLPDHAYTTGALAVAMAAGLGWPRTDVRMVGVAGLLCDAGMGLVQHPVRRLARPLTEIEINAARRHPELSLALARQVDGLAERIALAVYQHHERCDGSGYPEGARAERLHDYSRVVGVADACAGMTSPRMHRPALTPQAAMSELASQAAAGKLDRSAVRALLDVVGLFPAGSFVRLSTGHIALVGASGGGAERSPDRPVVHIVQPSGSAKRYGQAIDLARVEPKALRVLEAVRAPEGV
jgi:HD-GYP domain-containing protein (c-di-GMP phosphodiesterase class II)